MNLPTTMQILMNAAGFPEMHVECICGHPNSDHLEGRCTGEVARIGSDSPCSCTQFQDPRAAVAILIDVAVRTRELEEMAPAELAAAAATEIDPVLCSARARGAMLVLDEIERRLLVGEETIEKGVPQWLRS